MSTYDRTWQLTPYRDDGYGDEVVKRLYGGMRREDVPLSETAIITRMGTGTASLVRAMNAPEEPVRWEPPVVEFGRGPLDDGRFDWGVAAFVALCLGMVGLWAGILVYGLVRGLEELGRAL